MVERLCEMDGGREGGKEARGGSVSLATLVSISSFDEEMRRSFAKARLRQDFHLSRELVRTFATNGNGEYVTSLPESFMHSS